MEGKSTREQARFLNEQLSRLYNAFRYSNEGVLKERPLPIRLQRAQSAIRKWERAEERRRDIIRKRISKALDRAKTAVLFEPPRTALRAVQQAENVIKEIVYGKKRGRARH